MKLHAKKLHILVACVAALICCAVGLAYVIASGAEPNYIYFDLAAGNVTIKGSNYEGYAYQLKDGIFTNVKIEGTFNFGDVYYVYQSKMNSDNEPDGYFTEDSEGNKIFMLPTRTKVSYDGKTWGAYITNNTSVENVINAWTTAAADAEHESTTNRISVTGQVNATLVIDNLWSSHHAYGTGRTDGGISFFPKANGSHLTIQAKGDNRFGNIFYSSYSSSNVSLSNVSLSFVGDADSTLTVADFQSRLNGNYWNSAIGASDNTWQDAKGLIFESGIIFAGTTKEDDCTAIGGGGNGFGGITIKGGTITAVVTSSGAAIGGGIGKQSAGGQAEISITGGKVYAYNNSCASGTYSYTGTKYIPAAAIGGGSSGLSTCSSCKVTITGGKVYAQSVGGTAIGGGSSADTHGGDATVIIGGDARVEAKSIAGEIAGQAVPAGAAIGGGTGGAGKNANGGNVTLTIQGNATVVAGSIGGGGTKSTGGGKIGAATVEMNGGTLQGQIVMAKGSSTNCTFTMTGGTIDNSKHDENAFVFLKDEGGAIWMDDGKGEATLSGGSITGCSATSGGAVYMTAGSFTLSGSGKITNCSATSGGAVYMGGGTFTMSGGEISNNKAQDGAGAYLASGTMTVSGGKLNGNTATLSGGGAYLGGGTLSVSGGEISNNKAQDGAGAYLANGTMTVSGGKLNGNTATLSGGGAYLGGGTLTVLGGEISNNKAQNGAGALVANGSVTVSGGTLNGNIAEQNGGAFSVTNGNFTMTGGTLSNNKATNGDGGAVYVSASNYASISIRSGAVTGNSAGANGGALGVSGEKNADFIVTIGSNTIHQGQTEGHHACESREESCPKIENNTSSVSGGAIYLTGSKIAKLYLYCVVESENKVGEGGTLSDFMKVEGGTLKIDTGTNGANGNVVIGSTVYVTGGVVTIAGSTANPMFTESVTVDVDGQTDKFEDKREGNGAFTIQYFENFTENGVTSGRYTLFDITGSETHTVKASMYSHEGYDIDGWTLEGGNLYMVGSTIEVTQKLVFRAKWSVIGYKICFEAGVDGYSGSMEPMWLTYEEEKALTLNAFIYVGYDFVRWEDENGALYTDGQKVKGLSSTHGAVITLTAKWEICNHNEGNYTISATASVATRQCHCQGYCETVSLSDINAVYDGEVHAASVEYTYEPLNGKEPTNKGWENLSVAYSGTDNDGNDPDDNGPKNAGNYTATITINENTIITATIIIARAEYPSLPATPEYEVINTSNDRTIRVIDPNDKTDYPLEYLFSWYEGTTLHTSADTDGNWAKPNGTYPSQTLNINYTNYYVDVRYAETCNYKASIAIRGAAVFTTGGVEFEISTEAGLSYNFKVKDSEQGVTITLTPANGYYIYQLTQTAEKDNDGYNMPTLTESEKTSDKWTVDISNITNPEEGQTVKIKITFSGAEKRATVSSVLVKDEVFGDITAKGEQAVTISRDSAFTVYFAIENFKHYSEPAIAFDKALPAGSTIILRDGNGYWSYTARSEATSVKLSEFKRMGATSDAFSSDATSLKLQFVIDFSDCATCSAEGTLTVSFKATAQQPSGLDTVPTLPNGQKNVTLAEKPSFKIDNVDSDGLSATLDYEYAFVSDGVGTSKWDATRGIICLTPQTGTTLPADARLELKVGDATVIYPLKNGKFTLALPANGKATATLTLLSDLLPNEDRHMEFQVELYSSATAVGSTPSEKPAENALTLSYSTGKTEEYAISAAIGDILPTYKDDKISNLTIKGSVTDNTDGFNVKVTLYSKDSKGNYVSTGLTEDITISSKTFTDSLSLASMKDNMANSVGSLSMMLKVELQDKNNATVDSVPIYFILVDSRQ